MVGDLVKTVHSYSGTLVSIYRDGVIARHPVSSSLTRTELGNFRVKDESCSIENKSKRKDEIAFYHTVSNLKRKKSHPRFSKLKARFLSANLLFPKKMPRSIKTQKSTENPLHIFYPITEDLGEQTRMIYLNNSSHLSIDIALILTIIIIVYNVLES